MKQPRRFSFVRAAAVGTLAALGMVASAGAAPVVYIDPPTSDVAAGSAFNLNVEVADFTDLYSWQFSLFFDPTVLSATSVTEGDFLSGVDTTFFIPGVIDNVVGSITFNADTLLGPLAGASGAGTLASFGFTALAAGASTVSFGDLLFLNSALDVITVGTGNGRVDVTGGGGVSAPEPGSLALLSIGLLMILRARRRQTSTSVV